MSNPVVPEPARLIAERLFTNGQNERAARLVLELADTTNGGGWSINAAYDQVKKVLEPLQAKIAELQRGKADLFLKNQDCYKTIAEQEAAIEDLEIELGKEQVRMARVIEELQRINREQAATIERMTQGFKFLEAFTRSCVACASNSQMIKDLVDGALALAKKQP